MAPTLVLLHGFTHTGASWGPVLQELGESYRGAAPDIRGHGTAWDRTPVTLEAVVGDIATAAPERFTLAGYSMGGRIALHFAVAHPARVERLVLIGASPGIADPGEREARRRADDQLADEVGRSSIEQFADRWATAPVLTGQPASVAEAAREDRLRNHPAGLARALRGLGTGAVPSLWDRLGELAMPVTLVVGERDQKFRAIATQMAGALPDPAVVVVRGAGHAVHLEAPCEVAGIIAGAPA
ncbi:MAG TPA: 2-succinyl-6-hydroxy-2,4-cyclohexadiene-1-carboxylate synthase [Solirubrobacteraceae bacterium]|jgi:2-succinyl-6-hydroxy-2,4-cyclohexadiene-1-carboxylate synthase